MGGNSARMEASTLEKKSQYRTDLKMTLIKISRPPWVLHLKLHLFLAGVAIHEAITQAKGYHMTTQQIHTFQLSLLKKFKVSLNKTVYPCDTKYLGLATYLINLKDRAQQNFYSFALS